MSTLTFTVPGTPVGKARARTVRLRNGASHSYTPDATLNAENLVRFHADRAMKAAGLAAHEGPVYLDCLFVFGMPKSWPKWRRALVERGEFVPHTVKPDLTNLTKLVEDAMNAVVWRDDSAVCVGSGRKRYGLEPRTVVTVTFAKEATRDE